MNKKNFVTAITFQNKGFNNKLQCYEQQNIKFIV